MAHPNTAVNPRCDLTAERAREMLHYNADTGVLTWKVSVRSVRKGDVAGTINARGYRLIKLDGARYRAHRLAWLITNGTWPSDEVDHINGQKDDNSIANLRDVSRSVNSQNQRRARSDSRSGLLGVRFDKSRGNWRAGIGVDGKELSLGRFDTPEAAHDVYVDAKRQLHAGCTL